MLLGLLPFQSSVMTWGDEIYFSSPLDTGLEDGYTREIVDMGDLAYWPEGKAICLFFGPTPISSKGEIRPASSVNVLGKIDTDLEQLKHVSSGTKVEVS